MSPGVHLPFLFPGNFSLIFERKRAKKLSMIELKMKVVFIMLLF